MTKRLLIAMLALGLTLQLSGCSSGGSKEDGEVATSNDDAFADEGSDDFADEGSMEGSGSGEATAESAPPVDSGDDFSLDGEDSSGELAEGGDSLEGGDDLSLDGGDELAASGDSLDGGDGLAGGEEALPEDVAQLSEPAPTSKAATSMEPPPSDQDVFGQNPVDMQVAEPAPMEPTFSDPSMETAGMQADPGPMVDSGSVMAESTTPSYVPVKKIREVAFDRDGTSLNRVYLARSGDSLKAIAEKIYGDSSRSRDLKSWNPTLRNKPKVGDKVYYQSPKDAQDTRMLTYFEDVGAQPSVYVSKDGDNIRTVSEQLLGTGDSWKEVWATNMNIESKGDIPSGLEIKYWPEGSAPSMPGQTMAEVDPSVSAPPQQMEMAPPPPPPQDMAMNPPPPPPDFPADPGMSASDPLAMNDPLADPPSPPMDPLDGAAMGGMGSLSDSAPPPPEPQPIAKQAPPELGDAGDADTLMAIGLGGILLIAAALLFVMIRKNRAKRVDLTQTQV